MATKRSRKVKTAAATTVTAPPAAGATVEQHIAVSFQNMGIEWKPRPDGSAELLVAYEGPLATRDAVIARTGTWRQGSGPWTDTRELPLQRQGGRWVGVIPIASGVPVEAVEFVFRANDEWDNGGRAPLGYYEWNPHDRRVEVR